MLKFEHSFEEEPKFGDLSVNYENPTGATIRFTVDEAGIWLNANKDGFRYLACIFAELSVRDLESGYHFHRPEWFEGDKSKEVSVGLLDG